MSEGKKNLTLLEAASNVAGYGVGGGIMAVPYLASFNGIVPLVVTMIVAYLFSLLLHLMLAEIVMRDPTTKQLVDVFGKHLFTKRGGKIFLWTFFVMIVLTFYASLTAYIVVCGDILVNLIGVPLWSANIATYIAAAGVAFFGLKVLGICEKYAVIGIAVVLGTLTAASFAHPFNPIPLFKIVPKMELAFFGMVMYSFMALFSVPQSAEGLSWNKKLIPWSVAIGLGINFVFTFTVALMALLVSKKVTPVVIIGWSEAIGSWAQIFGSVFVILAVLTSYWAVSYALVAIIQDRLKWGYRKSWIVATIPSLFISLINMTGFIGYMSLAGGATAIFVAVLVIPVLRNMRKEGPAPEGAFTLGFWGNTPFQIIVMIAYIIMAIGSVFSYQS